MAESWMASQSNTYDREIDEAMHYRRWLDIKACMKLCNFYHEKDRKATDYDPTEKYRLVWDTMTHNMRQVIKKMGLDHTIDETTWPSASYSDMHNCVQGKKCTKGEQHVLLLDAQLGMRDEIKVGRAIMRNLHSFAHLPSQYSKV
jgi:hypothetical protein